MSKNACIHEFAQQNTPANAMAIPGIKFSHYVHAQTFVFTLLLTFGIMQIWHSFQLLLSI
jgi:hypothetical protein